MPGGKPKGLLAVLLINRNRVVSADSIADAIWDGDSPASYLGILQVYMSTLRRSLRTAGADGQAVITTQAPGYKLSVDDACVDLGRFTRWVAAGNELLRAERFAEASARYRAALAEWSGPALADLRGLRFADDFAVAVEEERLVALQSRIEADLACGMDSAVIGELTTLTGQHPLREPFWIQLITALYRLGRQADALDASRRIRQLLGDELGIDPSPPLRATGAEDPAAGIARRRAAAARRRPCSERSVRPLSCSAPRGWCCRRGSRCRFRAAVCGSAGWRTTTW